MTREPVIDDAEVLEQLNAVRRRVGWEPLSRLPSGDPSNGCACVLGRSWAMLISPNSYSSRDDRKYDTVAIATRSRGPNGPLLDAVAEVLGGVIDTVETYDENSDGHLVFAEVPAVIVDGDQPLMRWMWRFDHQDFTDLIDWDVGDPLNMDTSYKEDFTHAG